KRLERKMKASSCFVTDVRKLLLGLAVLLASVTSVGVFLKQLTNSVPFLTDANKWSGTNTFNYTWSGVRSSLVDMIHQTGTYDGTTTGSQYTLYGINHHNRMFIGFNSTAQGSVLSHAINTQIKDWNSAGNGGGTSEYGGSFNVLNTYSAFTN